MKTKTIEELAKIEALRTKKAGRGAKRTAAVAEQVKKEVDNQQPRVGRARDPQKKSASKSLSRKRVDAKKEEKESLMNHKEQG
jgi:hypothetical protein